MYISNSAAYNMKIKIILFTKSPNKKDKEKLIQNTGAYKHHLEKQVILMGVPISTTSKVGNLMYLFYKFWKKKCTFFTILEQNGLNSDKTFWAKSGAYRPFSLDVQFSKLNQSAHRERYNFIKGGIFTNDGFSVDGFHERKSTTIQSYRYKGFQIQSILYSLYLAYNLAYISYIIQGA